MPEKNIKKTVITKAKSLIHDDDNKSLVGIRLYDDDL